MIAKLVLFPLIAALSALTTTAYSQIFVANAADRTRGSGTIGEYTTLGETVNSALIKGLTFPVGVAVSEAKLFVVSANPNRGNLSVVGEYTMSGKAIDRSLITGLFGVQSIAV